LADDIFVIEPPKGPVKQIMGAASEFYGIWKFAKNGETAIEFLKYYVNNWPEAFKASEGYNNPCFANLVPKPMPILSNDPTSTPHDKLSILQDSDKWSAGHACDGRDLLRLHHQRYDGEDGNGPVQRRGFG
jgi:multiple sugar transport system substrate-binding protein